jgi:two-component system, chemotaxis family, response regulator PixG
MTTDMTVVTKIAYELMDLHQRRATGELVITLDQQPQTEWKLYFYLGRLVYAAGGDHSVRRWYRAFRYHCADCWNSGWLRTVQPASEPWEVDVLNQAVSQGQVTTAQAKLVIQTIIREVVFAFVECQGLQTQWSVGKQVAQQSAFLAIDQVIQDAYQLREQWRNSGLGHLQELLTQFSPDLAPVIRDHQQLSTQVSHPVYESLNRLMQGKLTLWDVAVQMQRPLPAVMRSLLPLIRQGVIGLQEIPDLPSPFPTVASAGGPAVVSAPPSTRRGLIACIDDSPAIGQALSTILTSQGFESMVVLNPLQGLSALLERKPDLVFLDLMMPNTNGYELCTILRKTAVFQNTPIIILTGNDGVIDRVRAKLVGATEFVSKPPQPAKIIQILQRHLGYGSEETPAEK